MLTPIDSSGGTIDRRSILTNLFHSPGEPHSLRGVRMSYVVSADSEQSQRELASESYLPTLLTPLLGRDQETATLRQLLRRPDVRLITLSGPGGVGKTSLALRVAHEVQEAFADGVFFISLAPISDPTLIAPTIAQTLSLPESPHRLWLDRKSTSELQSRGHLVCRLLLEKKKKK